MAKVDAGVGVRAQEEKEEDEVKEDGEEQRHVSHSVVDMKRTGKNPEVKPDHADGTKGTLKYRQRDAVTACDRGGGGEQPTKRKRKRGVVGGQTKRRRKPHGKGKGKNNPLEEGYEKRMEIDLFRRSQQKIASAITRINYFQNYRRAYLGDRWRGGGGGSGNSNGKKQVMPWQELNKAKREIARHKLKIINIIKDVESANQDHVPCTLGSEEYSWDNVFCAVCRSDDATTAEYGDILVCDGYCSRAYHLRCHTPALEEKDIPEGDDPWLCAQCACRLKCFETINDRFNVWWDRSEEMWDEEELRRIMEGEDEDEKKMKKKEEGVAKRPSKKIESVESHDDGEGEGTSDSSNDDHGDSDWDGGVEESIAKTRGRRKTRPRGEKGGLVQMALDGVDNNDNDDEEEADSDFDPNNVSDDNDDERIGSGRSRMVGIDDDDDDDDDENESDDSRASNRNGSRTCSDSNSSNSGNSSSSSSSSDEEITIVSGSEIPNKKNEDDERGGDSWKQGVGRRRTSRRTRGRQRVDYVKLAAEVAMEERDEEYDDDEDYCCDGDDDDDDVGEGWLGRGRAQNKEEKKERKSRPRRKKKIVNLEEFLWDGGEYTGEDGEPCDISEEDEIQEAIRRSKLDNRPR